MCLRAKFRPISVYRLGEMPIQSCGQSVSARRGNVGVRSNAHTELQAKRQRSAREAIYRNWPIPARPYSEAAFHLAVLFREGRGVDRNHAEAFKLFTAGPHLSTIPQVNLCVFRMTLKDKPAFKSTFLPKTS
jgi:hypothetical protein